LSEVCAKIQLCETPSNLNLPFREHRGRRMGPKGCPTGAAASSTAIRWAV
jgi:hypothetical protein